jgi:RNA polymerase sigma-70 factor, ECF subfamily
VTAERTDNELIESFLDGDEQSFNVLVRKHQDFAYAIARKLVGNHEDAVESAQRVFVKLYGQLGSFDRRSAFTTWLYRVVTNESLNLLRKRRVRRWFSIDESDQSMVTTDNNPLEALLEVERKERLLEALDTLPDRQRAVFVLRMMEGRSYAEISEILGVSEGSLKASFFHAVKKLSTRMEKLYENR